MIVRKGSKIIIEKIIGKTDKPTVEQVEQLWECAKELSYAEYTILRHMQGSHDFKYVSKVLEMPVNHIKKVYNKAIRHLRAPLKYYRILTGLNEPREHFGSTNITQCGFTTRTKNVLLKNGFTTIEELEDYIGKVPVRSAYIECLGKVGMSEILYYFMKRNSED